MGLDGVAQRTMPCCVSYARSDLEVETQDEDEVYELQFGRYFGKGKVRAGPLDEE